MRRINNSNLLLIAVDGTDDCGIKLTTEGQVINYNYSFPCHKLEMNNLLRRRLDECFTQHEDEDAAHYCGGTGQKSIVRVLLFLNLIAVVSVLLLL